MAYTNRIHNLHQFIHIKPLNEFNSFYSNLKMQANLLKISEKLPPQSRFLKSPSAQGLPSQSSRPPVTMPGTITTGWSGLTPSRPSLVPGDSGTWKPVIAGGKVWYKKKRSHQVVHMNPIIQQQLCMHLHSLGCLLFLFLLLCSSTSSFSNLGVLTPSSLFSTFGVSNWITCGT